MRPASQGTVRGDVMCGGRDVEGKGWRARCSRETRRDAGEARGSGQHPASERRRASSIFFALAHDSPRSLPYLHPCAPVPLEADAFLERVANLLCSEMSGGIAGWGSQ